MATDQEPNKGAEKDSSVVLHGWIETIEHDIDVVTHEPAPVLFLKVLKLDLPYILMLSAAVLGIGYISFSGQPTPIFWELLVPLFAAICIIAGWRHVEGRDARIKLAVTQALHWIAVLVAMNMVYMPQVRSVENNNASGITLMTILALATFLAGVHTVSWQICAVGIILTIAVPAIALIEQSALFMTVVVIGLLFVVFTGASLWWTTHTEKRKASKTT
jgi:hypothetical protein